VICAVAPLLVFSFAALFLARNHGPTGTCPPMRRLAYVLVVWISFCLPLAHAESAIDGLVQLPALVTPALTPPRYQTKTTGQVAPPESPCAVVYLEGSFPARADTNPPAVKMEQKQYQFAPGLLPIQSGTVVEFPNLDDGYHNVFSYSKPKRFDLGRYRKDEKPPALVFDKPGVIKVFCEIHQHMRGTILVLDTPFFVKTAGDGKYRLDHLPSGKFMLKAWLDEKVVRAQPVELSDGALLHVNFPEK
jgi:plastocyanin